MKSIKDNGAATKIYSMKDLSAIATEKIAGYISKGYIMNVGTMSGSQGDILMVDLTKNDTTVRVRIYTVHDTVYDSNRTAIIETRKYEGFGFKSTGLATLWNDAGEVIDTRTFYAVSSCHVNLGNVHYTDDIEVAKRATDVRKDRAVEHAIAMVNHGYQMTNLTGDKVIGFINNRPGYKRAKAENIRVVYRYRGHYYAEFDRLPSKNANRIVKLA